MTNGHHVVVEGPFFFDVSGVMHRFDSDIARFAVQTQGLGCASVSTPSEIVKERASLRCVRVSSV